MDELEERDLSRKRDEELTTEEKQELARRFEEFSQLVREKGPARLGIEDKPKKQKRIRKWDPAALAGKPKSG